MNRKCVCCGSEKLIEGVQLLDTGRGANWTATLSLKKDPEAVFFSEPSYSGVEVLVCEECAYVHLFACDLVTLINAKREREYNHGEREHVDLEDVPRCKNCNTAHTRAECPKCGFMI